MVMSIAFKFAACALAAASLSLPAADPPLAPQPPADRPLAERFAEPAASARILRIIHAQRDKPAAEDELLRTLAAQGFGGFVGNVAFDGYVDDETKWPPFLYAVKRAKAAGMSLWLYDECGYPSGSARDLTLRGHPEWAARGLLVAETNTTGGEVALALPPGALVMAAALPVLDGVAQLDRAVDLAALASTNVLRWTAPAGRWCVVAMTDDLIYEGTHAAVSLALKKPCINLLMPEPTARFLEVTHAQYAARLDQDLGKYFVSTFTDEPSLMNLWMRPMPYRVLPWSSSLADEFRHRRGEALRPLLPALVVEAGPRGAKARYDFWLTVAELVSENYFGQIQTWCRRHGVASGGHLLMEENLAGHVPLYGDFFRCARRLDAPSMDCLTSVPAEVPWYVARMIGSIADLEGRAVTMSETSDHSQRYRPPGDTRPVRAVTADEIRGTCNRLLWGGIDTITSYYSFSGLDDDLLRQLNRWVGRCSTLLAGGHQVADVAVLYPIDSLWPKFVPARNGATDVPAIRQAEHLYRGTADALYAADRDFTFVDSRALQEAKPRDDALVLGPLRWRAVVLPAADTLPRAAWENLARFWRQGGTVIAVGTRPANSDKEFPSPLVQDLAREMFGEGDGTTIVTNQAGGTGVFLPAALTPLLPRMLDAQLERDAHGDDPDSPIRTTHRRIDGHDVYFAINDGAAPWRGTIRFPGRGVEEQWDPATGAMQPLTNGAAVALALGPYGAMLFRAGEIAAPVRRRDARRDMPVISVEPLPAVAPIIGKGEFVDAALGGDAAAGWSAPATLTKSQVDTHLFLSFRFPQPLDLRGGEGLLFETLAPDGQPDSPEMLVILHTADGVDYLASTARMLSAPGWARTHVVFSHFARPGWAKPGPDRPDLSHVAAVSVGWGGHYGQEGEKIALTVKPPQKFAYRPSAP
jgi:hypothetical protein